MTAVRLGIRALAAALALGGGALLFAAPAGAIQTTTWGIQPADRAGAARAAFVYPSNGQTVHDTVIVYNRTAQPEVIDLSVLSATHGSSGYQYSDARTGLAAGIRLAANRIPLGPNQQANVPVTFKLPGHTKQMTAAAISAEGAPVKEGALLVQQQLIILVKAQPSTSTAPAVPDIGLWGPLAGLLLAVVGGLAGRELRKRRRYRGTGPGIPPERFDAEAAQPARSARLPVGSAGGPAAG